jgi:hypothetical protein
MLFGRWSLFVQSLRKSLNRKSGIVRIHECYGIVSDDEEHLRFQKVEHTDLSESIEGLCTSGFNGVVAGKGEHMPVGSSKVDQNFCGSTKK